MYFMDRKAPRRYPAVEWTTPLGLPVDPEVYETSQRSWQAVAARAAWHQMKPETKTYVEDKQWVLGSNWLARAIRRNLLSLFVPPEITSFGHVDFSTSSS